MLLSEPKKSIPASEPGHHHLAGANILTKYEKT
jgi:hypothetical protein